MADTEHHGAAENSVLIQRSPAVEHDPTLLEARRKFASHLDNVVLDYKHYHPSQLDACVGTLHTIFGNVVQNPEEPKYRKIKAANKKFLTDVLAIKHTEELLLQAGWRPKVVEMEKSWLLEAEPGTHGFKVLQEAYAVLGKVSSSIHEKAERKRKEDEERKSRGAAERERIKLALEDDRRQRHLMQELTAHHEAAGATSLPSPRAGDSVSPRGAGASGGGPFGHSPGE